MRGGLPALSLRLRQLQRRLGADSPRTDFSQVHFVLLCNTQVRERARMITACRLRTRAFVRLGSKTADDLSFRPDFMTFNHRGRVWLPLTVSRNDTGARTKCARQRTCF